MDNWLRVIVSLRSSGAFGRIEIRSSAEASQSTALSARSLFPLKGRKEFAAHDELPTTTNRPCESCLPVLYVPAAAIVIGPFLFFGSFGSIAGEFKLVVARLVVEESNNFCTVVLSPFLIWMERESGNPVAVPFMPFTIG